MRDEDEQGRGRKEEGIPVKQTECTALSHHTKSTTKTTRIGTLTALLYLYPHTRILRATRLVAHKLNMLHTTLRIPKKLAVVRREVTLIQLLLMRSRNSDHIP
jgi:hypothetical protein